MWSRFEMGNGEIAGIFEKKKYIHGILFSQRKKEKKRNIRKNKDWVPFMKVNFTNFGIILSAHERYFCESFYL